jgi:ABC-type transport system involved in multi-copper enzyme maturation permease subunit
MVGLWCLQILAVIRLEMKKTFFAKRGMWVYLLAFAPVVLYMVNSINNPRERQRLSKIATDHRVSAEALNAIEEGFTREQVTENLGEPYKQNTWTQRRGDRKYERGYLQYTDGESDVTFRLFDGNVVRIDRHRLDNLETSQTMFATSFQFYFLRLAIFFGCVGIFVNLFRGEMLDKSLHFYLLTPMRREVLLTGKYFAGLLATVVIFTSSTALQWFAMLWQFERPVIAEFLASTGGPQLWAYLGVTALACVGYGSIFLAIGLLFKNPVVPAAVILLWESINPFLPAALKKISMIFYLQSLSPVNAARDGNMPPVFSLLISPTEPATPALAITGILLLTLIVLVGASFLARRLEINYSTD